MNRTLRMYSALLAVMLCLQTAPAVSEGLPEAADTAQPVVTSEPVQTSAVVSNASSEKTDVLPVPENKVAAVTADEPSESAPAPTATPEPTQTPAPTATPAPTQTPAPTLTPEPAESIQPSDTVAPDASAAPVESAVPEVSKEPSASVTPEASTAPTESAVPEASTAPSASVTPEASIAPAESAVPEVSKEPDATIAPDASAEPETSPEASVSPEPSAEAPLETLLPEETPAPEVIVPDIPREKPRRDRSIGWKGVVQSDERGMPIPMLFQGDYKKVVCYRHGQPKSVSTSGCGATSVSMVIAYLTGNTQQNPYSLFFDAVDNGHYNDNGLSHSTLTMLAAEYGVHSQWIYNDADAIIQALQEGKPVIAHMGYGIFTERGHYIVLRGVTEDGKILVNDPANRSNCRKAFPIETLLKQARNSTSFMVCWTDVMPTPAPSPTAEN